MNVGTVTIILGMMVVTYIPRLLPGLLADRYRLPAGFERWLQNIPYAALGALIFPGIVKGEAPSLGIVGGVVAVVLSLLDLHLVLVMTGTILFTLLASYFL